VDLEEPSCLTEPQQVARAATLVLGKMREPEVLGESREVSLAKTSWPRVLPTKDEGPGGLQPIEGLLRTAPVGTTITVRKWKRGHSQDLRWIGHERQAPCGRVPAGRVADADPVPLGRSATEAAVAAIDLVHAGLASEQLVLVANRNRPGRSPSRPAGARARLARRRLLPRTRPRSKAGDEREEDRAESVLASLVEPERSRPRRRFRPAASVRASGLADRRSHDCGSGRSSRSRPPTPSAPGGNVGGCDVATRAGLPAC
jgi:hypothetical protein